MLERLAYQNLADWKNGSDRKALMITGARQIGKTTLVRQFAQENYNHFVELNFLLEPNASSIFSGALDASTIIGNLTAYTRKPLEPGNTLVLLDEIQECPRARTAIKALVEDGRFDYIETGSLLGVKVKEVPSYPVGFEKHLRMHPMGFLEFCLANGVRQTTIDSLQTHMEQELPLSESVHGIMMKLFQAYIVVGGMPEVVARYVETHDIAQVVKLQQNILALYRQDIAKYADARKRIKIREIFDAIPAQLDDKNRRFVLANLGKSARQNRYSSSFLWLADAGVALPCYNLSSPTLPLNTAEKRNLFKFFMGDVGLLCCASMDNVQLDILKGDLSANMGSIAENVIAQELVCNGFGLHYFNDKKHGEVDFVVQLGKKALPIEVKSGKDWKKHRALDNVLDEREWSIDNSIVFCKGNIERSGKTLYLPLYLSMLLKPEALPERLDYIVDISGL